jgi:hypothetical protein
LFQGAVNAEKFFQNLLQMATGNWKNTAVMALYQLIDLASIEPSKFPSIKDSQINVVIVTPGITV